MPAGEWSMRRNASDRLVLGAFVLLAASSLGLKAAAVKALQELVNGFPGTAEARTAQQELNDLGL